MEQGHPGPQPEVAIPSEGEPPRVRETSRRRIRALETIVEEVVQETQDAVTLVLSAGGESLDYLAGQFVTVDPHQFEPLARLVAWAEELKGKREKPRAYSLSSAPHEPRMAITVKQEPYVRGVTRYPPLLSPYLVHELARGARLTITGFAGPYVLTPDVASQTDHLVHVVAGSGAVPNFAIAKEVLAHHPRLRQTFVYSNKSWDEVIFREALAALEALHPDQLRVVHALTRDSVGRSVNGRPVRQGRIGPELLRELIPDPGACLVYACGPAIGPLERAAARERGEEPQPRFLEAVTAGLREIGVPEGRIKRESYG
jgi:ferredoxin-NADP reductase